MHKALLYLIFLLRCLFDSDVHYTPHIVPVSRNVLSLLTPTFNLSEDENNIYLHILYSLRITKSFILRGLRNKLVFLLEII